MSGISDTDTKLANRALEEIGNQDVLSDLATDTSTNAKSIRRVFDDCVDSVLQDVDWNFNAKRASLPQHSSTPAFDFTYQYAVPSDYLKIRALYDPGYGGFFYGGYQQEVGLPPVWRVEVVGTTDAERVRVISCDIAAPLKIIYSCRMKNFALWSPLAREALVYRVASSIAMPIAQSKSLRAEMLTAYNEALGRAARTDAQEASGTELYEGSWVSERW